MTTRADTDVAYFDILDPAAENFTVQGVNITAGNFVAVFVAAAVTLPLRFAGSP